MPPYETVSWPLVKARWFTDVPKDKPRKVRVIVIHTMEAPEGPQTAENVARYFTDPRDKNGDPVKASAHVCIDHNSVVQCVYDSDVAYAAPGANHDGIQIELAGYARQSLVEWLDYYSLEMLNRAGDVVAQYCLKYGIPALRLSDGDLAGGRPGIVGHAQVSRVYKKSTHTDPGLGFPWGIFIELVKAHMILRR